MDLGKNYQRIRSLMWGEVVPRTYTEQLQRIVTEYREAGEPWPASSKQIASWAIGTEKWKPQRAALVGQCAEHLSRAMREEYSKDPQGRSVRIKHAARTGTGSEQLVLWADVRTASAEHMQVAFQQRRQQIVGDCQQLKIDADSYNENYNTGPAIQLSFDFTRDLLEIEAGMSEAA